MTNIERMTEEAIQRVHNGIEASAAKHRAEMRYLTHTIKARHRERYDTLEWEQRKARAGRGKSLEEMFGLIGRSYPYDP